MPPKDKPQLYILRPDGTKVMLGEIWDSEIICESGNDICDEHWITQPVQEYEFTARWNPNTKILYFMLHGDFPTNNWLRMHGYKTERKTSKKKPELTHRVSASVAWESEKQQGDLNGLL